jgi:hypothetical protein
MPTDSYNNTDTSPFYGFYLETISKIQLNDTNVFDSSNVQKTINVVQKQYNGSLTATATATDISYNFFTDVDNRNTTNPSFYKSLIRDVSCNDIKYISGIPICNNLIFNIDTSVNNIGKNFRNATMLKYYNINNVNIGDETNRDNILSNNNNKNGSYFTNPVEFSRNLTTSLTGNYSSIFSVRTYAYSPNGSSSYIDSNLLSIISDKLSYNDSNYFRTDFNNTQNTLCHISSKNVLIDVSLNYVTNVLKSSAINGSVPYDNIENIVIITVNGTSYTELLFANGKYTTNNIYYIDYTSYYPVGPNYSRLFDASYGVATFSYSFTPGNYNVGRLIFTINDVSSQTITSDSNGSVKIDGSPMYFFYRFADNSANLSSFNTAWIDATNYESSKQLGSNNYKTTFFIPGGGSAPSFYFSSNITINSVFVPFDNRGNPINLYFRVVTPMNKNFSFSYVSATLQ